MYIRNSTFSYSQLWHTYLDIVEEILTFYLSCFLISNAEIPRSKHFVTEGVKLTTAFNIALLKVLG